MSRQTSSTKPSPFRIVLPAAALALAGLGWASGFEMAAGTAAHTVEPADAITLASAASSARPSSQVRPSTPPGPASLAAPNRTQREFHDPATGETAPSLAGLRKSPAELQTRRIERDRLVVQLDQQHAAESVDAAWAAQSEIDILSAAIEPLITDAKLSPQNIATDCRSRTCRISASFAQSSDARTWARLLVTKMGGTLSQVRMTLLAQPDGSSEIRIYGSRKLPRRGA